MMSYVRPTVLVAILMSSILFLACEGDRDDLSTPLGAAGGAGASCTSGSDCGGTTPVCDELMGACVQCLFDTQCAHDASCNDKTCLAKQPCSSSLECVGHGELTICDAMTSVCVECVEASDCIGTADCIANECVPFTGCSSSLQCPPGQVCASAAGRCVECEAATDCPAGDECIANACETVTACASDNQCTPLGKLCDKALGICVDCLGSDQCPDAYHCTAGACVLDVCQAGASRCEGNSVVTCSPNGDQWLLPQPCGVETSCQASGGSAGCVPKVCDAGLTYCEGSVLVSCAADGMSVIGSQDCSASAQNCFGGVCTDQACVAGTTACEGHDVVQCNAQGSATTVIDSCTSNEVCEPSTAACVALACSPGVAVCNGNVATTCNGQGTGFDPGGTDCASQGKVCAAGSCATCSTTPGSPSAVRFREVFLGTDDYLLLENRGNCPAQLDALSLEIRSSSGEVLDFDFPSRVLQPGEQVYVRDTNSSLPSDITSSENIYLTSGTGEYVMLCVGVCSATTVVDYFAHASGQAPPAAPFGITFSPAPLAGITLADENDKAYLRSTFSGSFPAFSATDWAVGPASRPYENPSGCPAAQPTTGDTCTGLLLQCTYGGSTCICYLGTWQCM